MYNMKKHGQKVFAILLCVVMVFSFMVIPAGAVDAETWEMIMDIVNVSGALEKFAEAAEYNAADDVLSQVFQDVTGRTHNYKLAIPSKMATSYAQVMKQNLVCLANDWNYNYRNYNGISWTVRTALTKINGVDCWVLALNVPRSEFVMETGYDTWFLCDGFGNVLYATADDTAQDLGGEFVSVQKLSSPYRIVGYDALCLIAERVGGYVRKSDGYYFIYNSTGSRIWHSSDGLAYAALSNSDEHAIEQDRETTSGTVTEGGNTTNITNENNDYSQDIDIDNMTQVLPGGTLNQIENLIYDANTKTYYVDSFNTTNNNYNFTLYEYHINYTSITYIGYTEQYDKYYELYYELPDGRDSADLTASDLEQISTSFKDVMNYARSADDLNQRVLYHFDGNTEDSSYWSYCTDFHWEIGASLTYMDEGVFDGSLYLDETRHRFSITLPGAADLAGDWTLQFRYYQSHTLTPQWDSGIWVGEMGILHLNGTNLGTHGIDAGPISIGSWNEICLMRKDGIVYYYLNGVCVTSQEKAVSGNVLLFDFGTVQQTYKKIDELRFTRGAIYTPGQNYTPTSVPYDSNLTLVLPDERIPVADEIEVFTPSASNHFSKVNLVDWTDSAVSSYLGTVKFPSVWSSALYYHTDQLFYNPSLTSFSSVPGATRMTIARDVSTYRDDGDTDYRYNAIPLMQFGSGLFLSVGGRSVSSGEDYHDTGLAYESCYRERVYTVSVVLADGSFSYATFIWHDDLTLEFLSKNISSVVDFEFVDLLSEADSYYYSAIHRLGVRIYPRYADTADIVYMEFVTGSAPGFSITYEGAVYDPAELTESPVLAVRSNLPITTYQIGGVRPSYPQKGQVYAMVERGYITSLQQYTGSAWEAVDGRIWTGSRWIPASSYNVITLQDMYDIVDSTPDYEYIYSESGFWDWFQRAWKDLIARLDKIIDGQKGSSGGGSVTDETLPPVADNTETDTDEGWSAYDLLIVIKDGTWSFITGVISTGFDGLVGFTQGFSHITGFFDAYDADSSANVLGITNYGGSDIWD